MKLRESSNIIKLNQRNLFWFIFLHIFCIFFSWYFFTWQAFIVSIIMVVITSMVGISFGFHRLLTHSSFTTLPLLKNISALCGTLALQGGPISWVGQHRLHHVYADRDGDPHNSKKGFWYSHIGFLVQRRQDLEIISEVSYYCRDISQNKYFIFLENNMLLLQICLACILFLVGAFLGREHIFDWYSGASFVAWGIIVRILFCYHTTFCVNSVAHTFGKSPNKTSDNSKNNFIVGLFTFGEGWHNNHHAHPRSARHGWKWWQIDFTWYFINFLRKISLIKNVITPDQITCKNKAIKFS